MSKLIRIVLISISITFARSQLWDLSNPPLQPVHGLFVKPSVDGTTGDLYVAATEDNGNNAQWLTDQPINFLAPQQATGTSQEESGNTQKRAILTNPPIKYTYAWPTPGSDGNAVLPYPWHPAPASTTTEESKPPCTANTQQYSQFQYFYPQMMSAIAHAFNAYNKDNVNTEEVKVTNQAQAPAWPYAYSYPFQYVMVDPNAWSKQLATPSTTSKTTE